jgi:hypothetical protein
MKQTEESKLLEWEKACPARDTVPGDPCIGPGECHFCGGRVEGYQKPETPKSMEEWAVKVADALEPQLLEWDDIVAQAPMRGLSNERVRWDMLRAIGRIDANDYTAEAYALGADDNAIDAALRGAVKAAGYSYGWDMDALGAGR